MAGWVCSGTFWQLQAVPSGSAPASASASGARADGSGSGRGWSGPDPAELQAALQRELVVLASAHAQANALLAQVDPVRSPHTHRLL